LSRHRPQKKWGQNFLRNAAAAEKIVAAVDPAPGELILEIGPGEGVLTRRLAELPNRILAIEVDPALAERLSTDLSGSEVAIRNADALEAELPDEPFRAVGNLPYNVGTPIMRRLIASPHCRRAVFMLQKEVADRIVASPGTEDYGFLTLYVQLYASAGILMVLGPGSFHPRPKVRSAVVSLDPRDPQVHHHREELLALISASFRMRRKTLANNLTGFRNLTKSEAEAALDAAKLPGDIRAEQLSLADFDRLGGAIGLPVSGATAAPAPDSPQ
jgi:16S rRNA (adenine1518-N6/adenine1519-N6)-dimethyltransferase